jgi:hypothetical protein
MSPVLTPEVSIITPAYPPEYALSGLYQAQTEKYDPNVMEGMVKYWGAELAFATPLVCAKYATFCRSVMLPGMDAGLPVGTRLPVTPDASTRKALGWNW